MIAPENHLEGETVTADSVAADLSGFSKESEDGSVHPLSTIDISSISNRLDAQIEFQSSPQHQLLQEHSLPTNGDLKLVLSQPLRSISLKFVDVSYMIKVGSKKGSSCLPGNPAKLPGKSMTEKIILEGITGIAKPGEILAMLGPSGSGKTTLLTALAGRLHNHRQEGKVSGCITYNGRTFSSCVKRAIGYVSQDDVLYPHLTVLETLVFTALLRLPNTLSKEERKGQAERVLAELGLNKCKNRIIGGPLLRGISGGERKRVSIGQEMLVNPSLLLLDEPTSGMDSTTAQRIVSTLQCLARGGRTVVTTIHQPSSRLYHMFDRVLLLCEGNCIYSGRTSDAMDFFASLGFSPSVAMNPADFLLDLANGVSNHDIKMVNFMDHQPDNGSISSSIKQSLISAYSKNLADALKGSLAHNNCCCQYSSATPGKQGKPSHNHSSSCEGLGNGWSTSWWEEFCVLLARSLKERKHESFSGLRIFQVVSVSFLSGLMWWHSKVSNIQDQVGLLFFFSVFWGFFPLFNAVFTFPQERTMLVKERNSRMYHLSAYFLARTAGDLPMELILPTMFVTITYWMGGLKPSVPAFVLTLFVILYNVLVSQGIGLAMGAILMDTKQGATLASVLMLTFLLAGGYYIQHIPFFISWLRYFSFSYYCYKLLLGVQYSENELYVCGGGGSPPSRGSVFCRVADYPAVKQVGLDHKGFDVWALAAMLVGYRLIAYAALRMGRATRC